MLWLQDKWPFTYKYILENHKVNPDYDLNYEREHTDLMWELKKYEV